MPLEDGDKNNDKYKVNTKMNKKEEMKYYEFVGKLIGCAIRSDINVNLNLTSIFWKTLIGDDLNLEDLYFVNPSFQKFSSLLKNFSLPKTSETSETSVEKIDVIDSSSENLFEDSFSSFFFSVTNSDGEIVDLIENGKKIFLYRNNFTKKIFIYK